MKRRLLGCWMVLLAVGGVAWAQNGSLEGRIVRENGRGIGAVSVVITELGAAALTDRNGNFSIADVQPGSYTVIFTLGSNTASEQGVTVSAGQVARIEKKVDWDVSLAETITVFSASRRAERIVEAPSAVTTVTEEEIERQSSHGQVPKLLEFTPGAEVTQSGLYDYNFNTRGFNSSLNRRVATLIDGRDPSVPFLGAQEWPAVSFPLDDIANIELVRGPSAALYGANASSGVLNMTTKQPRYSEGGTLRLTGGEISTFNADLRFASQLAGDWYIKVNAGVRNSGDFSVSRNGAAEYSVPCMTTGQTDCLPQEAVGLDPLDDNEIAFGSVRLDRYFANGSFLTVEGGSATIEGPLFQSGIGRVQLVDVERPWVRFNYTADDWNFLFFYNKRDAPEQTALSSGNNLVLDTDNVHFEAQRNWSLNDDKVNIVVGGWYEEESIDSFDSNTGRQTLIFAPVDANFSAIYSQVDIKAAEKWRIVLAGRFDDATLHEAQYNPKASIVFSPAQDHSLRLTYNEGFQVANYSEFFLQADVAPPVVGLAALEPICTAEGVDCGFGNDSLRVLALGNESLEVEEIETIELGYTGIVANRAFITFDIYQSENSNFITDLIPNVAVGQPRTNPSFGAYTPPSALSAGAQATLLAQLQGALGANFFALTNNLDGSPIIGALSYTNFGSVDTEGADLGLNYYFSDQWNAQFSYSYFDFELENAGAFADQLVPNTPEHKVSAGFAYTGDLLDFSVSGRWVDEFRWVVGPFQGNVESYETIDVNANYKLSDKFTVGVQIANATDNEHFQSFGGDLIERRALATVAYNWK